jgi:hypothetical protein
MNDADFDTYNQIASQIRSNKLAEQGNLQASATAKAKTIESLYDGIGGGFIEPTSLNLLRKGVGKVAEKLGTDSEVVNNVIDSVSKGDVKGAVNVVAQNIADNLPSKGTKLGTSIVRSKVSKDLIPLDTDDTLPRLSRNINNISNVRGSANAPSLTDPFKMKNPSYDDDLKENFLSGKISKTELKVQQDYRNSTDLTRDSEAVNQQRLDQSLQFKNRLSQLGSDKDTVLNAPNEVEQEVNSSAQFVKLNQPKSGGGSGGGDADDVDAEAGAEMEATDEAGGFDPVADVIGAIAGGLTLLFGNMEAEDVKPPKIQTINPSFQAGV